MHLYLSALSAPHAAPLTKVPAEPRTEDTTRAQILTALIAQLLESVEKVLLRTHIDPVVSALIDAARRAACARARHASPAP